MQLNVTRYVVIVWFAENNEKLFSLDQMNVSVWYAVVKITTFRISLNLKKMTKKGILRNYIIVVANNFTTVLF